MVDERRLGDIDYYKTMTQRMDKELKYLNHGKAEAVG